MFGRVGSPEVVGLVTFPVLVERIIQGSPLADVLCQGPGFRGKAGLELVEDKGDRCSAEYVIIRPKVYQVLVSPPGREHTRAEKWRITIGLSIRDVVNKFFFGQFDGHAG